MNNVLFSQYREGARPGREQNLLIGVSKHLYCLKDGSLKYQQKAIDPRLAGTKELITRMILLDVDTGTIYGECHTGHSSKDLMGFLARAWSKKDHNPMHGLPSRLNLPKIALSDEDFAGDIQCLADSTNITFGELPSGFSAGIHAVKQFEKEIRSLMWRRSSSNADPLDLYSVQACSGLVSNLASNSMSHSWDEKWREVAAAPLSFFKMVDSVYDSPGAWQGAPFSIVLYGPKKKDELVEKKDQPEHVSEENMDAELLSCAM